MTTKRQIMSKNMQDKWDNQCYALTKEQVIKEYVDVSKNYKPCNDYPTKENVNGKR